MWIAPCTVVAFYNGVRSRAKGVGGDDEDPELDPDIKGGGHGSSDQEASGGDDDDEDVVDEDDSSGCYRLKLSPMEDLDIPPEMASLDNYSASLAHKASKGPLGEAPWKKKCTPSPIPGPNRVSD